MTPLVILVAVSTVFSTGFLCGAAWVACMKDKPTTVTGKPATIRNADDLDRALAERRARGNSARKGWETRRARNAA